MQYADGTLGLQQVTGGRITCATLIRGEQAVIDAHNAKLANDPVTGELGELGFGTQVLPVSGRDIQDEKILGTMHVATGRSDHLGGDLTPDKVAKAQTPRTTTSFFRRAKPPTSPSPKSACSATAGRSSCSRVTNRPSTSSGRSAEMSLLSPKAA